MSAASFKLTGWTLAVFAPAAALGGWVGGTDELIRSALAGTLCLVLAVASLEASCWAFPRGFTWQFGVVLGGFAARMVLALALGFGLFWFLPVCTSIRFWFWLAFAYLLTLALEVVVLLNLLRGLGPRHPQAA